VPRALKKTPTGSESRNPFAYLLPLAPIAEVAVSSIPVVGTAVALYAVYVACSDPDATNEDRVFALVGVVPVGKIAGLLAHSKIVVAAIKVAEKGGAKAARGTTTVIVRTEDLGNLAKGERSLLDRLKGDLGSPQSNWRRNSGVMGEEMRRGQPIRDASHGYNVGVSLNAERNLLRDRDWTLDANSGYWMPTGR
jgi:hypothetical protein